MSPSNKSTVSWRQLALTSLLLTTTVTAHYIQPGPAGLARRGLLSREPSNVATAQANGRANEAQGQQNQANANAGNAADAANNANLNAGAANNAENANQNGVNAKGVDLKCDASVQTLIALAQLGAAPPAAADLRGAADAAKKAAEDAAKQAQADANNKNADAAKLAQAQANNGRNANDQANAAADLAAARAAYANGKLDAQQLQQLIDAILELKDQNGRDAKDKNRDAKADDALALKDDPKALEDAAIAQAILDIQNNCAIVVDQNNLQKLADDAIKAQQALADNAGNADAAKQAEKDAAKADAAKADAAKADAAKADAAKADAAKADANANGKVKRW